MTGGALLDLHAEIGRLRAALEVYREYVELLAQSEKSMIGIAFVHGYRCPDELVKRGEELRGRIAALTHEAAG
jgi:hypothetical protein